MAHESIEYGMNDVKELFDSSVMTGTIIEVNYDNDTAKVAIDGVGQKSGIPIFYHCADADTVAGGSLAFSEGDSVYVLNKAGSMKIVGFTDGLKPCAFYIDITINGKQPEYIKTLKIVDKNDDEHIAASSEDDPTDDLKKPWKVGPFSDVVWPAKIYLENSGGFGGALFTYFTEAPSSTNALFAKLGHSNGCYEPKFQLACGFGPYVVQGGDEEFLLFVTKVDYSLHEQGTFDSKPTEPISFTTKVLGRLLAESKSFDFTGSGCGNCSMISHIQTWEEGTIFYPDNVGGSFPRDCWSHSTSSWCALCLGCRGDWIPNYESCSINSMGIMTNEDGQNPVFDGATVQVKYDAVIAQCLQLEILGPEDCGDIETQICFQTSGTVSEAEKWEWKMLPTPEDRI